MSRIRFLLSISMLASFVHSITQHPTMNFIDSYMQDDYNEERFFIDCQDNSDFLELDDIFNICEPLALKSQAIDLGIIIDLLEAFGIIDILQEDFFLKTNILAKRSLLDSTLMDRISYHLDTPWRFGTFIFFNKTNNYNFTGSSTRISSYLALNNETIIQAIEEGLKDTNFVTFDPRVIFNIVQDMRLEQRNLGFLLYMIRQWEAFQLRVYVPLYYHERNFFLTDEQLQDIQAELNQSGDDDFRKEHVISDRAGFGDTRIEAAFTICEKPSISSYGGLQVTIPTAFSIVKGWLGSVFDRPSTYPDIPFNILYEAIIAFINGQFTRIQRNQLSALAEKFFLGAVDRLAANLLDDGLGNHAHVGLGAFIYTDAHLYEFSACSLLHTGSWINRASLEFLMPSRESRFFIGKRDIELFEETDFNNDADAAENLKFLEQEFINRFNLIALSTYVQPKPIFRLTSMIEHDSGPLSIYYGANFWVQGSDHLGSICGPLNLVANLNKRKSIPPLAYQVKILGGISYAFNECDEYTLTLGFDFDWTAFKAGIGRDYMLALRVDASF